MTPYDTDEKDKKMTNGSGSISQRYGAGSGSFYHPSIIKQKCKINLDSYLLFCDFFGTFYVRKIIKMYLQKVISRKTFFIKSVFVGV
jgi:hypothetical protein